MPLSITAKLHILLLMMAIGITLYMFILYREVRQFEGDIAELKRHVKALETLNRPGQQISLQQDSQTDYIVEQQESQDSPAPSPCEQGNSENDADSDTDDTPDVGDDASVATEEIQEILTTIKDDDEEEAAPVPNEQPDLQVPEQVETPVVSEPKQVVNTEEGEDMFVLTPEELGLKKYDELRQFLRRQGVNEKGTKKDYIQRILDIKSQKASS